MREDCVDFKYGRCKFGRNCRYRHITRTALLDPPGWIHSTFADTNTVEVHPIEARLGYMANPEKFKEEWDNLFVFNYSQLVKRMETLLSNGQLGSFTNRYVVLRNGSNLNKFVPPFDLKRVERAIRANCKSFLTAEELDQKRGYRRENEYPRRDDHRAGDGRRDDYRADRRDSPRTGDYRKDNYQGRGNDFYRRNEFRRDGYQARNDDFDRRGGYDRRKDNYDGKIGDKHHSDYNRDHSQWKHDPARKRDDKPNYYDSTHKKYEPNKKMDQRTTEQDDLTRDDIYVEEFVSKGDDDEFDLV